MIVQQKVQQVKSRPPKGWLFLFIILLAAGTVLCGCGEGKNEEETSILVEEPVVSSESSQVQEESQRENSRENSQESSQGMMEEPEASTLPMEEELMFNLVVEPGEYLSRILEDLSGILRANGRTVTAEDLLEVMEEVRRSSDGLLFGKAENTSAAAFSGEGYIAPGTYEFAVSATEEEILRKLFSSWDETLSPEILEEIGEGEYSFHEILTIASIIEFESSRSEDDEIKYLVSSVIINRLDSDTPLQMDVTVFYLEDGLLPYRDPSDYEIDYDTYEAAALPPGPIDSPSEASVLAALDPAETDYFFFIYDEEGNYYFASDYETHLENVETYLGD